MKSYQEMSLFKCALSVILLSVFSANLLATQSSEVGNLTLKSPENLTTWIFEDGTFIPPDSYREAKLQGYKLYSIITDHLGTPVESYDEEGKKVWSRELNIYGETRKEFGEENFIPFLYQGQYLDTETELAYNRCRYYSPESGTYISQDPIGLNGNNPTLYAYVKDSNIGIDQFGLNPIGSWNEFLTSTKGSFNTASNALSGSGDGNFMKDAASGWKEYSNSVNTSDLPAIGRLPDTQPLKGVAGNNILSTNRWTLEVNDAWLQGAIDSNKNVNLATEPSHANL